MFILSATPIDPEAFKRTLAHPAAGGYASFEGWVRNHNEGRAVARLEYEAYDALAVKEGERILAEAREKFAIEGAACVHRTGLLEIGEQAVWVGAAAAHRGEAFAACRYVIDQVKIRVPIWKKEHYVDGDSGWVNCQHCAHAAHAAPAPSEADYYARQTCLTEVGEEGQRKLKNARVLVVGAGGLGSPALLYLAAAGVGHIGLCEFDRLEASNLHRQVIFEHAHVGQAKVAVAADRLRRLNPFIEVTPYEIRLRPDNAEELFRAYDLVLDCTDNFDAKFLISDAAVAAGVPAVFSSIYQFEGQVQVYDPAAGTACLRCLWPRTPEPGCVGSCAEVGVLGVVPGVFGTLQAVEALKRLLDLPGALRHEMLVLDLLGYGLHRIRTARNPQCPACGSVPQAAPRPAPAVFDDDIELDINQLAEQGIERYRVVDIRESVEAELLPLEGRAWLHLPASRFDFDQPPLERGGRYLLCCARGRRSRYLAQKLRRLGFPEVYSLRNGIRALELLDARPRT